MSTRIKIRRDILANWQVTNPTAAEGELCIVTDLNPQRIKIGDGITPFNSLPYLSLPLASVLAAGLMSAADKSKLNGIPANPLTATEALRLAGKAVSDAVRVHFNITGGAFALTIPDSPVKMAVYKGEGFSNEDIMLPLGEHDVYYVFDNAYELPEAIFKDFTNVTEIELPNFVRVIGANALEGCTELKTLICQAMSAPRLGTDVFLNIDMSLMTLYVNGPAVSGWFDYPGWEVIQLLRTIPELP